VIRIDFFHALIRDPLLIHALDAVHAAYNNAMIAVDDLVHALQGLKEHGILAPCKDDTPEMAEARAKALGFVTTDEEASEQRA
jgi:hypothetical protein